MLGHSIASDAQTIVKVGNAEGEENLIQLGACKHLEMMRTEERMSMTPSALSITWKESVFWENHQIHHELHNLQTTKDKLNEEEWEHLEKLQEDIDSQTNRDAFSSMERTESFERFLFYLNPRFFAVVYGILGWASSSVNFWRSIFLFVHFIAVAQDVPPSGHFVLHLSNAYFSLSTRRILPFVLWGSFGSLLIIGRHKGTHPFDWRYKVFAFLMQILDAGVTVWIWY